METRNKRKRYQSSGSTPADRTNLAPFSQEQPENQKSHGKTQRPLVALKRLTRGKDAALGQIHRLDPLLKYIPRRIRAEGHKKSAGHFGDLRQPALVEPCLNRFA